MAWSVLNATLADDVNKLLDLPELRREPEGPRFLPREKTEAIIHAALWGYSSREGGAAGIYAFATLMEALEIKNWTFDEDEAAALRAFRRKRMRQKSRQATRTRDCLLVGALIACLVIGLLVYAVLRATHHF